MNTRLRHQARSTKSYWRFGHCQCSGGHNGHAERNTYACWTTLDWIFTLLVSGKFVYLLDYRHVVFPCLKFSNFIGWWVLESQDASSCQISSKSVNPLQSYRDFSIFQDGSCLPSWICLGHIWTTHEGYLLVFTTMQNFVAIDSVVSKVWKFEFFTCLAWKRLFMPQNWGFVTIWPLTYTAV